jgi:formylmethanofuran dehydrogenase subunit E
MIITNRWGEEEVYCDECGMEVTDDEEIYKVDDQVLCIFCLREKFKVKD